MMYSISLFNFNSAILGTEKERNYCRVETLNGESFFSSSLFLENGPFTGQNKSLTLLQQNTASTLHTV